MSKKSLFRTHVAFVNGGQDWANGGNVVWTKGNLQPYKQGISIELTEAGYRYNDWRVLYVKDFPELSSLNGLAYKSYFVVDGVWYLIQSNQDWTVQARGAKHFKLIGQKTTKPDGINTPLAIGELAQDFENAINELKQATKLL